MTHLETLTFVGSLAVGIGGLVWVIAIAAGWDDALFDWLRHLFRSNRP